MVEQLNSNLLNPEELIVDKEAKSTEEKSGDSKSPKGSALDLQYKVYGEKDGEINQQANGNKSKEADAGMKKANLVAKGGTQLPEPLLEENPNRFVILPI